jgi:hypothetical protein
MFMVLGVTNYILLLIVKSSNTGYIVLYNIYMTISVSIGLYPKLDSWNANKLQLQYVPNIRFHLNLSSCSHADTG